MRAPIRPTWLYALALLQPCADAVQVPRTWLPHDAPWSLPAAQRLAGIDTWRLHGVFRQRDGSGWALVSTGSRAVVQVELGAVVAEGISLDILEAQGVWLGRGGAMGFLPLSGAPQATSSTFTTAAPTAVKAEPSPACQSFAAGGVPGDELAALGICPGARSR